MTKHYKIIGKAADPGCLADPQRIRILVSTLVHDCGMHLLDRPTLFNVELQLEKLGKVPFEDEGGISCIGCLSTSHIAIHTWPLRQTYHMDIYSCRDFAPSFVDTRIQEVFGVHQATSYDLTYACEDNHPKPPYIIQWDPIPKHYVAQTPNLKEGKAAKSPEMALLRLRGTLPEIPLALQSNFQVNYDPQSREYTALCSLYPGLTFTAPTPIRALQGIQHLAQEHQKQVSELKFDVSD